VDINIPPQPTGTGVSILDDVEATVIPEPGSVALAASLLSVNVLIRRRRSAGSRS
jgi:hypothetical protein